MSHWRNPTWGCESRLAVVGLREFFLAPPFNVVRSNRDQNCTWSIALYVSLRVREGLLALLVAKGRPSRGLVLAAGLVGNLASRWSVVLVRWRLGPVWCLFAVRGGV